MWVVEVRMSLGGQVRHVGRPEFYDFVEARHARDYWRARGFSALLYPVLE